MASEPASRYLIRTAEGDKGPFTAAEIVDFLDQGRLKPNVRVLDQATGQAVLVAQIAREQQGGGRAAAAPAPAAKAPLPRPVASAASPPRTPSDLVREQRDRTTAAFSRKDLAVEVASAESIDIPADILADAHSRSGSGDQFSSVPRQPGSGERHGKPGTQRPTRGSQRATARGSRDGSRRLRSSGDLGQDPDGLDPDAEFELPRRGNRRRRQGLLIGGILGGIVVVLAVLGVLVSQQLASTRVLFDPALLSVPGGWTVDNEAMIAAGKNIDQFSFGHFIFEPGTLQTCNGKRWSYQAERKDREKHIVLDLLAADGTRDRGTAYIRDDRLWLTMPLPGFRSKELILRRGAPPLDPAAEMGRIKLRADPVLFAAHGATATAPVPKP